MTLERDVQREILLHGTVTVEGRIAASSNQALLVTVEHEGISARACYKAEAGERPLWDFADGLWRREVASSSLDELLATNLVPTTVAREDAPFGRGSLQWWIDDATEDHYFTLRDNPALEEWFGDLALFDVVANNADRKAGHVLFDGERCWAIDNGLTFHEEDKLRTVIWEFAGLALPEPWEDRLAPLAAGETGQLGHFLAREELEMVIDRAADLLALGHYPIPDEDREWPPYPWPLI
jgi:hypothetical protein